MPGPVLARVQAHLQALAEGGLTGVPSEEAVHASVRAKLGRMIGADIDELTLVHHTAEGIGFISHGLSLHPGDRIVLLENEYPSNVYPWQHWQGQGVQVVFAPLLPSPRQFLQALEPLLEAPTKVLSVSAVHWCTGMPLPLVEIGRLCQQQNILLVVDGAQGVGLVDIDVRAAGIGAMAFSGWKWLLGPVGLGALYVRRDLLDRLRFPWKGTGSVIDDHNYLPYRDDLKPGADRYVLSTPNYNDWVHFDASLDYLDDLGFAAVRARIHALARFLGQRLSTAGFALASDNFPDQSTGIVSAHRVGLDVAGLVSRLGQQGVVGADRLGRLRLAPHIYLIEDQLERAAALVARLAGT